MFPAYFYTLLIVIAIFGHYSHGSSITLLNTPSLLCVQDTVQFSCTVTSPGFIYESTNAGLNINSSINCVSAGQIGAGTAPRLSVMSTGGTLSAPSAQYTISPFLLQDNMTQYRCCANNASNFVQDFTDFISLPLAALPSPPTIPTISSAYDSPTSCYGTITLTWLAVTSDRAVTSYEVYLNVTTMVGSTNTTTFTTGTLNLIAHYATYNVSAINCAGSGLDSSDVMFTALTPGPPSSFAFIPVLTNISNCEAQLNISLNIATNRGITYYLLYIDNQLEENATASGSLFNYSRILQLTNSKSNKLVTITAHSCAGSTSESATVYGSCDSNKRGLSTGEIVGIVVGGVCFIIIAIAVILLCCILIYFAIKRKTRSDQEERKK